MYNPNQSLVGNVVYFNPMYGYNYDHSYNNGLVNTKDIDFKSHIGANLNPHGVDYSKMDFSTNGVTNNSFLDSVQKGLKNYFYNQDGSFNLGNMGSAVVGGINGLTALGNFYNQYQANKLNKEVTKASLDAMRQQMAQNAEAWNRYKNAARSVTSSYNR